MNANFDADLEELEAGHCTVQPRDELDTLGFRDEELEEGLDELFERSLR